MTAPIVPNADILETVKNIWNFPHQPCGCPQCGQAFSYSNRKDKKNLPQLRARKAVAPTCPPPP